MPLPDFQTLMSQADAERAGVKVIAAGGADATVLEAMSSAAQRGWIQPVLTGQLNEIESVAHSVGVDLAPFEVVHCAADQMAQQAVREIQAGRAAMLMKGQIATPDLMRAVLSSEHGLRTGRTICQVVLMEIQRDRRTFLMSDTGICIDPTVGNKREILEHCIGMAHALGLHRPAAALMAATEKVTESMPDTVQAQELVELACSGEPDAGVLSGCDLQGPLSFDLAYASDAGSKKKISGNVVGAADIMVFPDLKSANLTVKGIMYTADCQFGGVLCGATVPVVFMSRADSTHTRLNSLALALAVRSSWPALKN